VSRLVKICPSCGGENELYARNCKEKRCRQSLANVNAVQLEQAVEPPPPSINLAYDASQSGPQPTAVIPALGRLEMTEPPHLLIEVTGSGNLGRGAETDLSCIPRAEHISRHHAQIVRQGGGHKIVAFSSTSGTFVQGRKIEPNQPTPISDGTKITLGNSTFVFRSN
jgi:hypothetical protein